MFSLYGDLIAADLVIFSPSNDENRHLWKKYKIGQSFVEIKFVILFIVVFVWNQLLSYLKGLNIDNFIGV